MRFTKLSVPLAALSICFAMATGCGEQEDEALTLTIVSEDWNGWDRDHEPTPETKTLEVADGASTEVRHLDGSVVVSIAEVSGDTVELTTSTPLAPRSGDGYNMNDTTDEFSVSLDQPVEFATSSLDGGYHYTVTLEPAE